jgi:hypothetical protein
VAEFGPVLIVLILIIILPLLSLVSFGAGYASVSLLSQTCAEGAANASTFDQALATVKKRALSVVASGLGKFAKLKPVGGYQGCGVDLYIATIDNTPNGGQLYGPNTGVPSGTTNPPANIYQYVIKSNFLVGPFLDLGKFPIVEKVPLVGQAVSVSIRANRAAEHTDCLQAEGSCQSGVRH